MSLGLYVPRRSPIHRLPVGIKLASLAIAGLGLFFVQSLPGLLAAWMGVVVLMAIAQLPYPMLWQQLRPLLPLLLIILVLHGWWSSWPMGMAIALRFLILVSLAIIISLTTRLSAMMTTLERWLGPLRWLGLCPAQISLLLAITIRFIPVLLNELHLIQAAQWARGCDRNIVFLLVPLLVRLLHIANDLTDAIEARGYDPEESDRL